MQTTSGELRAASPFDFGKSLAFLQMFPPAQGDQMIAEGALTAAFLVDEIPIIARLHAIEDASTPGLAYALYAQGTISADIQARAEDRIAFWLSLADDLLPFYALAAADPLFALVVNQLHGYHQVKFRSPFENTCWAILTQRNPIPQARRLRQAIVARYGESLELEGFIYSAFPSAQRLASASLADLHSLVENERRAEYLLAAATAFARTDEAWLQAVPYEEVEKWLRSIKGIGPFATAFVMLRGLGRMERLPVGELRLNEAASRVYGKAIGEAELERIAESYGPYQGYWAHYLRVAG